MLNKTAALYRLTGSVDRYGNVERDFELEASGVRIRIDEGSSTEPMDDANSTVTNARAYTSYPGILPFDELDVGGVRWRVVGDPLPRYAQSALHHYEIVVQKVEA